MSLINFRFTNGYHSPASGTVVFMPHRRHAANETEVLPKPFHRTLVDGELTVDLQSTAPTWVWSVTHNDTTLFYTIPERDGITPHTELIPIAPSTMPTPNNAVEPAWWAEIRQYIRLFTDTIARADEAIQISEDSALSASKDAATAQHQATLSDGYMRQSRQYSYNAHDSAQHAEQEADRAKQEADRIPLDHADTYYRGYLNTSWDLNDLHGVERVGVYNYHRQAINTPSSSFSGLLHVEYSHPNAITVQTASLVNLSGRIMTFRRYHQNDEWTAWEQTDWSKNPLTTGTDLDTIIQEGTYAAETTTIVNSITGKPTGAGSGPFNLTVKTLSRDNDVYHQTFTQWMIGGITRTWERITTSGVYGEWQLTDSGKEQTLTSSANLDTITDTGTYIAQQSFVVENITGKPAGAGRGPFNLTVKTLSRANDVYHQTFTQWMIGGTSRTWERITTSGIYGPWQPVNSEAGNNDDESKTWKFRSPIYLYGDSLTDAGFGDLITLDGTTIYNRAVSGDRSNDTLLRYGLIPLHVTPVTGNIPESGSVEIHVHGRTLEPREGRSYTGTIKDINGRIQYNDGTWTFTRTSAGDAVTVDEPIEFVTAQYEPTATNIVFFSANDITGNVTKPETTIADHITANYMRFVDRTIANPEKHILVLGAVSKNDTQPQDDTHNIVQDVNTRLSNSVPHLFVSYQEYMSQHALHDLNIDPTSEDEQRMNAGLIPERLYSDNTHFTVEAQTVFARHLETRIQERGWA